ncbi:MAG: lipoprotein-releasing ABC transporter permease subunit [Gammaproteobacteria bacterium]|nr:MAG: lipoprotein-releasing ABC transporter permease subunit [Gammaproteobacteria bacterium]
MFRPVELYVGLRYTRAKRRNHFISFISLSSMMGIALGVTALITVLSVMNGFEKEVRERILDMVSHLTVTDFDGDLKDWQDVLKITKKNKNVIAAAPYIEAQGMLINGSSVNGTLIRGVYPKQEPSVSNIYSKMKTGSFSDLKAGKFGIILGQDLARILGVHVGDKVTMVTPSANVTPAGVAPRLKRFTVVGVFYLGYYQYDSAMAFVHISDAQRLFRMKGRVTGVRAKLSDLFAAPLTREQLQDNSLSEYWVRDWSSYHANWFRAVKIEKRMIFLLLLLIVAVAAFNIVSTLVMVVTDKQSDIAILRTLGASPRSIMGIFMVQGAIIGFIGTLIGTVGGVSLALNLDTVVPFLEGIFGIHLLDPAVYYISVVPSDLHWDDVWTICSISLILGLVATLYPAWRASKTQPAEALRYE